MLARGILGSGRTRGVSFRPFPNSSCWWWLTSSVFLIRISSHKTTHANSYYGAWPGWAVSISVLPLTGLSVGAGSSLELMEVMVSGREGDEEFTVADRASLKEEIAKGLHPCFP